MMLSIIFYEFRFPHLFPNARLTTLGFKLQMDELACFVPGMLALGSLNGSPERSSRYLDAAKEVRGLLTSLNGIENFK
jgi:hypothetical protein